MTRNCITTSLLALAMLLCTLGVGRAQHIGDSIPPGWGGLPDNAPARRKDKLPTPDVYDIPASRGDRPLSAAEQLKLQRDLLAARERLHKIAEPKARQRPDDAAAAAAAAIARARQKAGKPAPAKPKQ